MTKKGKLFHAQLDRRLPHALFVFVPDKYLSETENGELLLLKNDYVKSGWAFRNAGANPDAIGSHIFPDLTKPIPKPHTEAQQAFLKKLAKLSKVQPDLSL
jgi:hypothetical protein